MIATEKDIKEFFSFSGDIQYVEMQKLDPSQSNPFLFLPF